MIIYKAENIVNNKVYIGQTIRTLEQRKQEHIREATVNNSDLKFHQALRKYGIDNFKWTIIENAADQLELDKKEIYWIKHYNSLTEGYNMIPGRDINPMFDETIKLKHDNIMRSDEVRQKISNSMKQLIADGRMFGDEHRRKISEKLKGNQHFAGHKRTPEAIEATAKSLRKQVSCYDETGKLVQTFNSVRQAAKWLYNDRCTDLKGWDDLQNRIKESNVKQKYYRGLIWRYE